MNPDRTPETRPVWLSVTGQNHSPKNIYTVSPKTSTFLGFIGLDWVSLSQLSLTAHGMLVNLGVNGVIWGYTWATKMWSFSPNLRYARARINCGLNFSGSAFGRPFASDEHLKQRFRYKTSIVCASENISWK